MGQSAQVEVGVSDVSGTSVSFFRALLDLWPDPLTLAGDLVVSYKCVKPTMHLRHIPLGNTGD